MRLVATLSTVNKTPMTLMAVFFPGKRNSTNLSKVFFPVKKI